MISSWEVHPRNIGFDTLTVFMECMEIVELMEFINGVHEIYGIYGFIIASKILYFWGARLKTSLDIWRFGNFSLI